MTLCLYALLVGPAAAFDSEAQPIDLAQTAQIFTNATFSTGFVPSGSPLQVQFAIEANGGADVSMQGEADLSWPEALQLQFTGDPGSGLFLLDASLDAVTTIAIDLSDWGYYGTLEVDRRTLGFEGAQFFDPFVLDGAAEPRVEIVDTGAGTSIINYTYTVFSGVDLRFSADMNTVVTVGFSGEQFEANGVVATTENAVSVVPYERVADYDAATTYTGSWDSDLSLVITPSVEACVAIFGCVTVAEFDVPLSLLQDSFLQDFDPIDVIFPLPMLAPGLDQADMGDADVGQIVNLEVPIGNDGSLSVYGDARIEGSTDFTVYPSTFDALPGTEDGLVVTFAPTAEGAQTAELVFASNDPGLPEFRIPLTANGVVPEAPDGGQNPDEETKAVSSCGCANGSAGAGGGAALVAVAGLLLQRRRRV